MEQKSYSIPLNFDHQRFQIQKGKEIKRIYLLLHGYLLDGSYILEELKDCLPQDCLIIAPNGPFPVPVKKKEQFSAKFAWYFFDPHTKNYYVNFEPAAKFLSELLLEFKDRPVTIIGYSQGGYLAPKVAELSPNIDHVIGICCTFRTNRFNQRDIPYTQINSIHDGIVDIKGSREEFSKLINNAGEFIEVDESGHRIDDNIKEALKNYITRV